jgi:hypothetical protein
VRQQQGLEVEVAGVVDQHRVAGLEQETADQVDRLGAGRGQQQLLGTDIEAVARTAPGQQLAQAQQASRMAVVGQDGVVGARQAAHRAAQDRAGHPVRRQPAAAGFQRLGSGVQRLPRNPERIDRAVRLGPQVVDGGGGDAGRHVEAGARSWDDHAFGRQPVIGFDDGRWRDPQGDGETADRRQTVALRQGAAGDPAAYRFHHLAGPAHRFASQLYGHR